MSLRIIATGGTFDKHYDPLTGKLIFRDSVLPEAIDRARLTLPVTFESLLALDSLDMQDSHRQQIREACERSVEDRVVIVHGTDTMPETAQVLGHAALKKTIVLTGAMVPYQIARSDAFFNLGYACAAASLTATGVYIAMNGQLFRWDDVTKNRAKGIFQMQG